MIAAVAGVVVWHSFFGTSTVSVPSVVGRLQAAATAQLRADGFTVKAHDDYSDQFGVGLVTRQQPGSGAKLAKGGTVDIYVSRGAATVTLQDFTGWTPSAVASYLARNGLVGHQNTGSSTAVAKGQVYKQSPLAGNTVDRGATVTYWVSKGQPKVSVPDLSGLDQTQATTAIQAAGLLLGTVTTATSTSVPAGGVVSQNPPANTMVARGSTVSIVISSGTPSPTGTPSPGPSGTAAAVPSVLTMPQAAGRADPHQRRLSGEGAQGCEQPGLGLRLQPVPRGRRCRARGQHRHHLGDDLARRDRSAPACAGDRCLRPSR